MCLLILKQNCFILKITLLTANKVSTKNDINQSRSLIQLEVS